jgi:UDP-3-O-[3-hydroxymyristoyl] glucosamine N-acyltransferase
MNENIPGSKIGDKKATVQYTLEDILPLIVGKYEIEGNKDGKYFTNIKPVAEADTESLVFIDHLRSDKQELIDFTKAGILICDFNIVYKPEIHKNKMLLKVEHPRLLFMRVGTRLFKPKQEYGIHPTAYIHPEAELAVNVYIGPFTYIGKCTIGENTVIQGHCFVYDNAVIGKNVNIDAGCIIGNEGFGFDRDEFGEFVNFPHIGRVIIEDNVEIEPNVTVDRGALGDTIIKRGAKIDNFVHVGHNVTIGRNTLVLSHAMIAGSTSIGDDSLIAICAAIRDQITIGNGVTVGMGAVVTRDIPDNETWTGSPARPIEEFRAMQRKFKNLK